MRILLPPFGYIFEGEVNADNEQDVLDVCLSLSDDPQFKEVVKNDTHKGRLKNLKAMGFRIENK